MEERSVVIGACIGWLFGPFALVYAKQKTIIRALVELLAIIAVIWATHYTVAIPFVLGYSMWGAVATQNYNLSLRRQEKEELNKKAYNNT